ncbi:MAG: DJ-1/PfpI family protein [Gemmatimonadales bacterium]|nr:DJ-1/PfpI family protein [Gemmatimonadales bacterium]
MAPRTVGILVFEEVEVLDVCGPYEVFSVAGRRQELDLFRVLLVGPSREPVRGRHDFLFTPHVTMDDAPPLDLLLVPGGRGTRQLVLDARAVAWVAARQREAELLLSVCTGALVLAKAGLLDGLAATTHGSAFEELEALAPASVIHRDRRVVDNGRVILSAGVAAGIDMALTVVARLHGEALARECAGYIEYPYPD